MLNYRMFVKVLLDAFAFFEQYRAQRRMPHEIDYNYGRISNSAYSISQLRTTRRFSYARTKAI